MKSLFVFLSLILNQLNYAQVEHLFTTEKSTGGGNGGETIDLNGDGYQSLKDLKDKAVCGDPLWGYELAELAPEFNKIINFIEIIHRDLADEIRKEMSRVSVCLSESPLVNVDTQDENAVTIYYIKGNQTGVRINNEIYIDNNHFKKTYVKDKGFFVLHELMHGLIPQVVTRRNHKVQSFVKGIELLMEEYQEQLRKKVKQPYINYSKLAHLIEKNKIQVPLFMNGIKCGFETVSIEQRAQDCESKFGRYARIDSTYEPIVDRNLLIETKNNQFIWQIRLPFREDYPLAQPGGYSLNKRETANNIKTKSQLNSFFFTRNNEWIYFDQNQGELFVNNIVEKFDGYAEYLGQLIEANNDELDNIARVIFYSLEQDLRRRLFIEVISYLHLPRFRKYIENYALNLAKMVSLFKAQSYFELKMLDSYYRKSLLVNIYNENHAKALEIIIDNAKDLNEYKDEIKRFGINQKYKERFMKKLK